MASPTVPLDLALHDHERSNSRLIFHIGAKLGHINVNRKSYVPVGTLSDLEMSN